MLFLQNFSWMIYLVRFHFISSHMCHARPVTCCGTPLGLLDSYVVIQLEHCKEP